MWDKALSLILEQSTKKRVLRREQPLPISRNALFWILGQKIRESSKRPLFAYDHKSYTVVATEVINIAKKCT